MDPERTVGLEALVKLKGKSPSFYAFMEPEHMQEIINEGGLSKAKRICFINTPTRPVPESVLSGKDMIEDIFIEILADDTYDLS